MTANKTIPIILLTVFLAVALPAGLYFRAPGKPALSPVEVEVAKFNNPPVTLNPAPAAPAFSGLVSPVPPAAPKTEPATPAKIAAQPPIKPAATQNTKPPQSLSFTSLPVLSMISSEGAAKTAIIDNHVVTEGTELAAGRIVKIEERRVLLRKAGKNIWLSIE